MIYYSVKYYDVRVFMDVLSFTPKDYFGSNTYLISSGDKSAVIDPSVNVECASDFFRMALTH